VVQGHRYNLFEDLGPITDTYNVTLAYPLYLMWEPLFIILSAFFGMMNVRIILKRRKILDVVLSLGSTNVSKDRYMRLVCFTIWGVVVHTPLATWSIIVNATQEVAPWISWENTHSNYGRIEYITRFMFSILPHDVVYTSLAWWSLPLCGFAFFVFFGFREAATPYQPLIAGCLRPFGIQYPREKEKKTKSTKRTWLDIIFRRPGKPSSKESFGSPSTLRFETSHPISGQPQTGTFAVDSVIAAPQFSFRDATTQGSNEIVEERDKAENAAQTKVTVDVEAQASTSEQWRHEIPERDPEWTEEVTF
jgi:hypothetical protein